MMNKLHADWCGQCEIRRMGITMRLFCEFFTSIDIIDFLHIPIGYLRAGRRVMDGGIQSGGKEFQLVYILLMLERRQNNTMGKAVGV